MNGTSLNAVAFVLELSTHQLQTCNGHDDKKEEENQERVAASKTVIIENIALDLGLTSRDV